MRDNVRAFVELVEQVFEPRGTVVEFGSFQVELQRGRGDLRDVFAGRRFVGCDMRDGEGVDRIEDLAELSFADDSLATILCLDTLEHVFEARRAASEMIRVLAPGGMIVLSAPLDFRIHNFPDDYWRITPACMARLVEPLAATVVGWQGVESYPHTVLAVGFKAPAPESFVDAAGELVERYQAWLDAQRERAPWSKRLRDSLAALVRGKGERRRIRQHLSAQFAISAPAPHARHRSKPAPAESHNSSGSRIDLA